MGLEKENTERMHSAYDARFAESLGGSEYDDLLIALEFYKEFQAETGKALQQYIQERCADLAEVKVLEAGPGTGITTLELLKADPRVKVVAVDNEPKMLEAVQKRFATISDLRERVDFVLADILAYLEQCEDESFDAFASVYTLHNFTPDFREKVITLIVQKLKPGGIFINGDEYAREEALHQKDYQAEIANYEKFDTAAATAETAGDSGRAAHLRQIKQEWTAHAAEDERNRITVAEQNALFEKLGLDEISWGKRFDLVVTVHAVKKAKEETSEA